MFARSRAALGPQFGGARLTRHHDSRDRRRGAGAFAHHADHQAPVRARRGRADRSRTEPGGDVRFEGGLGRVRRRRSLPPRSPSRAARPAPRPVRSPSSRHPVRPGSERRREAAFERPGTPGGWLKPKRFGGRHQPLAPTFTPSGANTELHDTANASASCPHRPRRWRFQLDAVQGRVSRVLVDALRGGHVLASRAAAQRDHLERRARRLQVVDADARRRPGSRRCSGPSRPRLPAGPRALRWPRAAARRRSSCEPGGWTWPRWQPAPDRRPAARHRASPQARVQRQLQAAGPHIACAGTPFASSSSWRAWGPGPLLPPRPPPRRRAGTRAHRLRSAWPSARTVPLRASSAARGGRVMFLLSASPAPSPGKTAECDQSTRSPSRVSTTAAQVLLEDSPKPGLHPHRSPPNTPACSRARPAAFSWSPSPCARL